MEKDRREQAFPYFKILGKNSKRVEFFPNTERPTKWSNPGAFFLYIACGGKLRKIYFFKTAQFYVDRLN